MAFSIINYLRKTYALHAPPVYDNPTDMNARESAIDQLADDHDRITAAGLAIMEAAGAAEQRTAMGLEIPVIQEWAPILGVGTGTEGSHSYSSQVGYSWKYAGIAAAWFYISLMKDTSMSGDICLKGLPYTIKNIINLVVPGIVGQHLGIAIPEGQNRLVMRGMPGTKTIVLRSKDAPLYASAVSSMFIMEGMLIYPVE